MDVLFILRGFCGWARVAKQCAVRYGTPLGVEHDQREYPANLHQKKTTALAVVFLLSEVGLGENRRSDMSILGCESSPF